MSEDAKVKSLMKEKMTPEQQEAAQKAFQKQQVVKRAAYKKELREENDLRKLQVEELELNIRYYNAKRTWLDLREKVNELDAEEQALIQEERRKRAELIEKQRKEAEEAVAKEEKPEIVIPKQGVGRES